MDLKYIKITMETINVEYPLPNWQICCIYAQQLCDISVNYLQELSVTYLPQIGIWPLF